jgi:hypothetical protein
MHYTVCPLHAGFAVIGMIGDRLARVIDTREDQEDAQRLAGDLNRFAGLVEKACPSRAAKQ